MFTGMDFRLLTVQHKKMMRKAFYVNTISDLAYIDDDKGIILFEYPSHFIRAFDLTSTQQDGHVFFSS